MRFLIRKDSATRAAIRPLRRPSPRRRQRCRRRLGYGGRSRAGVDQDRAAAAQVALFPEDRRAPELACEVVQVKLSGLQRRRARQWGACWLACELLYNRYYETFDAFRDACKRFFKGLDAFAPRLRTLLTEKFQIIGAKKPKIAIG